MKALATHTPANTPVASVLLTAELTSPEFVADAVGPFVGERVGPVVGERVNVGACVSVGDAVG